MPKSLKWLLASVTASNPANLIQIKIPFSLVVDRQPRNLGCHWKTQIPTKNLNTFYALTGIPCPLQTSGAYHLQHFVPRASILLVSVGDPWRWPKGSKFWERECIYTNHASGNSVQKHKTIKAPFTRIRIFLNSQLFFPDSNSFHVHKYPFSNLILPSSYPDSL